MSQTQPATTKPCPGCGKEMPRVRGVCPHCGHMTTWFKVRFFIGGAFILVGFLSLLAMTVMSFLGGSGE